MSSRKRGVIWYGKLEDDFFDPPPPKRFTFLGEKKEVRKEEVRKEEILKDNYKEEKVLEKDDDKEVRDEVPLEDNEKEVDDDEELEEGDYIGGGSSSTGEPRYVNLQHVRSKFIRKYNIHEQ